MSSSAREGRPTSSQQRTAWLLVAGQFALRAVIIVVPSGTAGSLPAWAARAADVCALVGLALMAVAALGLGRGLTAAPLPNEHARLRTGGLYRYARHPIYTGLLLTMGSLTVASGSVPRLVAFAVLLGLITGKARWEEGHLARRFAGYPAYAARTPRFVPRWRRRG